MLKDGLKLVEVLKLGLKDGERLKLIDGDMDLDGETEGLNDADALTLGEKLGDKDALKLGLIEGDSD